MSALGHKGTFCDAEAMSDLPPIADIDWSLWHVRFVPEADIHEFDSHEKKNPGTLPGVFMRRR
jgi:hypothetical protein